MFINKKKILFFAAIAQTVMLSAQEKKGSFVWQGQIGTIRVVLQTYPNLLTKKTDAFFLFPEESKDSLKVDVLRINNDSLYAKSDIQQIIFKGAFMGSSQAKGTFIRYNKEFSLNLNLVDSIQPLFLTQTPKAPFPYLVEKVTYEDKNSGIHFGATLTVPKGGAKKPVVVLVSGTGPQDRDGTMAGHKMFEVLADYLSRRGIAVLRVDDRGVGQTTGIYADATTTDFANDALVAVKYLKTRKEIDPKRIGLIGHSEGGAVISIAASQSKDIAFMVSLAGLAQKGLDALIKQNEDIVAAANISDDYKRRYNEINRVMFNTVYQYVNSPNLEDEINKAYNEWKAKDDEYIKKLNPVGGDHFRYPIFRYAKQAAGAWYRNFIQYDPAKTIGKITIPVLAINGDKDLMVACNENLEGFRKYLTLAGNKDFKVESIPGLNHLMQHCKECSQGEYMYLDETIAPEVLKMVGDWIEQHVCGK